MEVFLSFGEGQEALDQKLLKEKTCSSFLPQAIDTILIAGMQISSQEAHGVEECTLGNLFLIGTPMIVQSLRILNEF